jgi:predicted AAA+ superfamily ATPase
MSGQESQRAACRALGPSTTPAPLPDLARLCDQKQRPATAYSNYFQTYVERDVRQLIQLKELAVFERFIKLLAGRVGQLMDYASLAGDVGVSATTIKHWLSILEASFVVYQLRLDSAFAHGYLVYAGERMEFSDNVKAIRYDHVSEIFG